MLIQIDGWFAGGKTVLWSLLDGHSEIFVNPIHDFSHALLLNQTNDEEWLKKRHTTHLRKLLAPSEYYKFEKVYLEKNLEISFSTDTVKYIKYDVDFYKFDKAFFDRLNKLHMWNIETIIEVLYKTYYEEYTQQTKRHPKYYATMSHPGHYKNYKNIPSIFPNMKSITVKRGIKNIIATRTNRKERQGDLNEHQAFNTPFEVILQRNEIEKILEYYTVNEALARKYPKQFMVVDFDTLVKDTAVTMEQVANFLGVAYDDILSIPTRDGVLLEYQGMSFIGKENDIYEELLTECEIAIIDEKIKIFEEKRVLVLDDRSNYLILSKQMNKLHEQLQGLQKKYHNIALYGYGTFGEFVAGFLGENVSVVFDQLASMKKSTKALNICSLDSLHKHNFDVILITVLGREDKIAFDLVELYGLAKEKIVYLELDHYDM